REGRPPRPRPARATGNTTQVLVKDAPNLLPRSCRARWLAPSCGRLAMILAFLLAFGGTAGFAQTRVSGPALRVLDVDVPTVTARAEERSTLEVRVPVEIADAPSADWARLVLEYDSSAIEYRGAELTAEAIEQGWMPSARDGFREVSEGRLEGSF